MYLTNDGWRKMRRGGWRYDRDVPRPFTLIVLYWLGRNRKRMTLEEEES